MKAAFCGPLFSVFETDNKGDRMPFAVIKTGGKQHRVEPGQTIEVEKLPVEEGQTVELSDVLLVSDENGIRHGQPLVQGAKVVGRVVKQTRGPKIVVFKYKAKV